MIARVRVWVRVLGASRQALLLPFAMIPLLHFTQMEEIMGRYRM